MNFNCGVPTHPTTTTTTRFSDFDINNDIKNESNYCNLCVMCTHDGGKCPNPPVRPTRHRPERGV